MEDARAPGRIRLPATVWALGLVSFFMDVSSEMIHALLPLFLTSTLGVGVAMVGVIDGVAESTAAISKVFSGYWSDRLGRRKPFILAGYALGALSKPLFPLAGGAWPVFAARFADRIGKGLRGSPRDALIADVTAPAIRGRAFGLRQAMDTAGAFAGPVLAIALMGVLAGDIRAVFWVALIPAGLAVLCVIFAVQDAPAAHAHHARPPLRIGDLLALPRAYWAVLAVGVVFTLARFSEAFLILKASDEGLPLMWAPLVLVIMNVVYALLSYPAGMLADRYSARTLLCLGIAILVAADLLLAFGAGLGATFLGIALWGAHMALTQGLLAKLVADTAPPGVRGSAFGAFNLASGVALLIASILAGVLWEVADAQATFVAGALLGAGAAVLVMMVSRPSARAAAP